MNSFTLFDGAVRANPWLLGIDLLLVLQFGWSYFRNCYQAGFKIDVWHHSLLIMFIIPVLLFYPFAASDANARSVGKSLSYIQESVDTAFLLTLLGYLFTLGGYYLFHLIGRNGPYWLVSYINTVLTRSTSSFIASAPCVLTTVVASVILAMWIMYSYITEAGFGVNLRAYAMRDAFLRPIYDFVFVAMLPFVSSVCLVRAVRYRDRVTGAAVGLLVLILLPSGSRGSILAAFFDAFLVILILRRDRVNIGACIMAAFMAMLLMIGLGMARSGNRFDSGTLFSDFIGDFAFGNNLSDDRDFGWFLSKWDGYFLWGKTYLAALISFVPRSFSDFRGTWAYSQVIDRTMGFDPLVHPGIRLGPFGESYINFGAPGIAVLGLTGGYMMAFVDAKVKHIARSAHPDLVLGYSTIVLLYFIRSFYVTAGFWNLYVLLTILVCGALIRLVIPSSGGVVPYVRHRRNRIA